VQKSGKTRMEKNVMHVEQNLGKAREAYKPFLSKRSIDEGNQNAS